MNNAKRGTEHRFRLIGPFLFVVLTANSIWALTLLIQERQWGMSSGVMPTSYRVVLWMVAVCTLVMSRFPGVASFSRDMWQIAGFFLAMLALSAEYSGVLDDSTRTIALAMTLICAQILSIIALVAEIRRRRQAQLQEQDAET